jgi:hypothetical protein
MERLRIEIRTRGLRATPAVLADAERKVRKALGPGRLAGDVVAFLSDLNGPRGGEDKQCVLRARLDSAGYLFARAAAPDLERAVVQAARSLGRAVRHAAARRVEGVTRKPREARVA